MTLQRVVSAHAAAGMLVIRRLESMQRHANSRQAGISCTACLEASGGHRDAGPHRAWPGHWCASHAVILLLREEREITVRRQVAKMSAGPALNTHRELREGPRC